MTTPTLFQGRNALSRVMCLADRAGGRAAAALEQLAADDPEASVDEILAGQEFAADLLRLLCLAYDAISPAATARSDARMNAIVIDLKAVIEGRRHLQGVQ